MQLHCAVITEFSLEETSGTEGSFIVCQEEVHVIFEGNFRTLTVVVTYMTSNLK